MRKLYLFFLLLIGCSSVFGQLFPNLGGQRAGISALTFLKMDVSPRSAALASATTCLSGDAYSPYTNPATLTETENLSVALSNTFWAAGINYGFLSVTTPTKFGHFGVSLSGLSSGAMPVRTEFQPQGTGEFFYASYITGGVTYAQQLTEWFSYGASVKYVREQLADFTANTAVVDLGFLYRTDFKDLSFAVMLQSFGTNSTLQGSFDIDSAFANRPLDLEAYPAPTVFKIGLSMIPWQSADEKQSLTTLLQLNHPNDNAENLRMGVEYAYRELLFIRAGYKINIKDQNLPTAGVGLRMRLGRHPLIFDYAFDPLVHLGVIHRLGLSFSVNPVEK
ncbi:MAG: PorV/PorQ family protein [Bacteroidota bacterium]